MCLPIPAFPSSPYCRSSSSLRFSPPNGNTACSIYTHDPKLKRKLKRLAEKYPDKVYPDKAVHAGAVSYAVPKSCVSVREPFSDERRRAASERAKNAGYTPPARSISSENE